MAKPVTNPKFNMSVAPMYTTAGGNFVSIKITSEILERLASLREGGKLLVKVRPEGARKGETSPHAFMEYMTPEDVQKAAEDFRNKREDSL